MDETQTKELIEALGLNKMSEPEQTAIITEIGDLVMESVLLRLVAEMSEEQQEALDQFMEAEPAPEVLMDHLATHHSNFATIWEEEVKAFREDALAILADDKKS